MNREAAFRAVAAKSLAIRSQVDPPIHATTLEGDAEVRSRPLLTGNSFRFVFVHATTGTNWNLAHHDD